MKAIFQTRKGKPDVLELGDLPNPTCGPKDVLVSNLATSVNPRDCLIRAGRYQLQFLVPKFPLVLGSDCYDRVLSTGNQVNDFAVGDLVYGLKNPSHGLGTYADHVVIPAKNVAQAPTNISGEQAAGVPLCALTAWQALVDHGQLNKGHKILVIGASGGVGSFAVQIAKALSSNVDGICSAANATFVQSLGADRVYDYKTQDIKSLTGQYDIIFDTIGRHSTAACRHLLSKNSAFVTTVPAPAFMLQHMASKFFSMLSIPHIRKRVVMVKPDQQQLTTITDFIQQGKIVPAVDSVHAMVDVAEAHLRSQSKRAVGKIIIRTQHS
jgi:NADPH:quinone reductase-like Zn-dependent oxidoreductase